MEKKVSKAVLKRLPGYLAYLKGLQDQEYPYIFCHLLVLAISYQIQLYFFQDYVRRPLLHQLKAAYLKYCLR